MYFNEFRLSTCRSYPGQLISRCKMRDYSIVVLTDLKNLLVVRCVSRALVSFQSTCLEHALISGFLHHVHGSSPSSRDGRATRRYSSHWCQEFLFLELTRCGSYLSMRQFGSCRGCPQPPGARVSQRCVPNLDSLVYTPRCGLFVLEWWTNQLMQAILFSWVLAHVHSFWPYLRHLVSELPLSSYPKLSLESYRRIWQRVTLHLSDWA